ncbi:MAG: type IX secretion system sortase PorU [Bacteroidia bacterium]|nr:type IX secretion system sortase PorU [Bacteroidia bacterium]
MIKKCRRLVLVLSILPLLADAQVLNNYVRTIVWQKPYEMKLSDSKSLKLISFEGAAQVKSGLGFLPVYIEKIPLSGSSFTGQVEVLQTTVLNTPVSADVSVLQSELNIEQQVIYLSGKPFALIRIIPLRKNGQQIEMVTQFKITIQESMKADAKTKINQPNVRWSPSSVLATGVWFKIPVSVEGIYSLDYNYLKNLGIDMTGLNPKTIRIYGRGGNMLSQQNNAEADDDLMENAIVVNGEADGRFDATDKVLFYARGTDTWKYDSIAGKFMHEKNVYSDYGYYFLTFGGLNGKRVGIKTSLSGSPQKDVNSYDYYYAHEDDKVSFIKSGREWYGEVFDKVTSYDFNFTVPGLITSEPVLLRSEVVAHSFTPSSMIVSVNGVQRITENFDPVYDDYTAPWVDDPVIQSASCAVTSSSLNINYSYNKPALSSSAWLNFFELNLRRTLLMDGSQMSFRDSRSTGSTNTRFTITSSLPVNIWDVTDGYNVRQMALVQTGTNYTFQTNTEKLTEFIAFDGTQFLVPGAGIKVINQNLHAKGQPDMVIVAYPDFVYDAKRLADFHTQQSGMNVVVVTPEQIYNEFSSGTPDVSSVRNFMRMFYERGRMTNEQPKYLLMFGDASFDYRDIKKWKGNFVPTYESRNSYAPTASYCSDDFFGFLDPEEGYWDEQFGKEEGLDLGVGRLPVKSTTEAAQAVNKIISYYSSSSMRNWRNDVAFVADDEDFNIHLSQSNNLSAIIDTDYVNYNINKIFFDSYKQISTPEGGRYPDVRTAINNQVNKGCLIINYTGHGGETQWAHEQVLTLSDINAWTNKNALPLFITATCEFSKFDDPERTSAGELVLINPNGGGIGLFTTVRLVFAFPNYLLNINVLQNNLFSDPGNKFPTLGDVLAKAKNIAPDFNSRNFTLLGDPAMVLAYPKNKVVTTAVNGKPVNSIPDTIKALSKVTISGNIQDINGQNLNGFNGTLYVSVYDKEETYTTLANDVASFPTTYKMRRNVIYRGRASVSNGAFTYSFIVPKDISYVNGFGKISYYAENGVTDAAGNYSNLIIGGTSDSAGSDNKGPQIKLYMNDFAFVSGGTTNTAPLFLATLFDENGINTAGNGIGREITATIDGNVQSSIIMNDYYQANLNSFTNGQVKYNFSSLTPGVHNIKLKAWDVFNNSSEASLEFIVASEAGLALNHVLNYPNPFTTSTTFQFDHNKYGQFLQVQIQIYSVSGKLIKTINQDVMAAESHFTSVPWDGRDEYGDKLAKGVYVYKVRVKSSDGEKVERFEKLVLLN